MPDGRISRFALALLLSAGLVVGVASPASAQDVGNKTYTWPAHCSARTTLMVRQPDIYNAEGILRVYDPCKGEIGHVDISYIKLQKREAGTTNVTTVGSSGAFTCSATFNCDGSYDWYLRTNRARCQSGAQDTVWTVARYRIVWRGGSATNYRVDKSYEVRLSPLGNVG